MPPASRFTADDDQQILLRRESRHRATYVQLAELLGADRFTPSDVRNRYEFLRSDRQVKRPTGRPTAVTSIQAKTRPCLCCKKSFFSEGFHNRLCTKCTSRSADISPFSIDMVTE